MNFITVACPECGLRESVPVAALLAETVQQDTGADEYWVTTNWICRVCGDLVTIPVDGTALPALAAAGVTVMRVDTEDARPTHPESCADGPPLTADDLLAFHQDLTDDTKISQLLNLIDPP